MTEEPFTVYETDGRTWAYGTLDFAQRQGGETFDEWTERMVDEAVRLRVDIFYPWGLPDG